MPGIPVDYTTIQNRQGAMALEIMELRQAYGQLRAAYDQHQQDIAGIVAWIQSVSQPAEEAPAEAPTPEK